jgi:predicted SAM-dependent methyltransferase
MSGIVTKIKSSIPVGTKIFARRAVYHSFLKKIYGRIVNELYVYRESVANTYIKGDVRGIEIGALDRPMRLNKSAKTLYVDRMAAGDLINEYGNKQIKNIVKVDIIDDGEKLDNIKNESLDYVIANHYLEHCRNPILAVSNMLRVLKKDGILFLTVPDKRFTFDSERPVTQIGHIIKDYQEGPEWSDREHYEEWVKFVVKVAGSEIEGRAAEMMNKKESIHFHVWTQKEFLELLESIYRLTGSDFEIEHFSKSGYEVVAVLRKN